MPAREQPLTKLIDHAGLMRELGVKRAAADAIMRHVPKVRFPGVSKVYVKRVDVARLLEESTSYAVAGSPLRLNR